MGWSAGLTQDSAVGSSITFTPDTIEEGAYTVSSFTAPRKGVFRFQLKGSGGSAGSGAVTSRSYYVRASGGVGGSTIGYLLLEKGQTVYVGAGGACSAAFVSSVAGLKLSAISRTNLYFVAGGGGAGGAYGESRNNTGWNCIASDGGSGGGTSGAASANGGAGGTQSAGGSAGGGNARVSGNAGTYGAGGASVMTQYDTYIAYSGRGGDGLYGGGSGHAYTHDDADGPFSARGFGGGGGSAYMKDAALTVMNKTYTSTTSQGGGAASGSSGSIVVTYYARAELPMFFDGVRLERLFFNGIDVESLVYNGVKLFFRRLWRRMGRCAA